MRIRAAAALAMAFLAVPGSANAQVRSDAAPRPEALNRLVACRQIADETSRVKCYDREVASLDEAERKRDIVLVDRQGVRAARRSLFGLQLPSFRIFGDSDKEDPEFTQIETRLASASRSGAGWLFVLQDGARWLQTEAMDLSSEPRAGSRIRIRRAALGSYLANVDGQRAIRVRRIN